MQIIGAGLAGLIAANIFPQARVIEAAGREKLEHKAVLRFRSTAVAEACGIDFRKVRVFKSIYHEGKHVAPSILLANLYSQKVIGKLADRSILNIESAERYIAPEDFVSQLIENCGSRISWNTSLEKPTGELTISTMPMSVLAKQLNIPHPEFQHAPISVWRMRIEGADVFQTIYFPEHETKVYRASITGDLLIIEAMGDLHGDEIDYVLCAFGVKFATPIESSKQKFGKIAPIDDVWRKQFILEASMKHNIYSVGRFATWRNILLDDVVHDLNVVKRLIKTGHLYQNHLEGAK